MTVMVMVGVGVESENPAVRQTQLFLIFFAPEPGNYDELEGHTPNSSTP